MARHTVWPLFTVSHRNWTSSATSRSASLSMCSTCLMSASSPPIWPFTSSRFSEILHEHNVSILRAYFCWNQQLISVRLSTRVLLLADSVHFMQSICLVQLVWLTVRHITCLSSHRKRTMFQNIVNATEPMADEKEAIAFISNNSTRKEIVMYVTYCSRR